MFLLLLSLHYLCQVRCSSDWHILTNMFCIADGAASLLYLYVGIPSILIVVVLSLIIITLVFIVCRLVASLICIATYRLFLNFSPQEKDD